jgi:hypothetical protein
MFDNGYLRFVRGFRRFFLLAAFCFRRS